MGDEDGRHGPLRGEIFDERGERAAQGGVERSERLVEQERVAVREQQPAEGHPVPLAAGQPGRHRREQPFDAERRGDLGQLDARRLTPAPPGPRRARVGQVGPDRQVREQPGILSEESDAPLPRRHRHPRGAGGGQRPPAQLDAAGTRLDQAGDHLQDGRLPRPGRAEQRHPLPVGHVEGRADGEVAAVSLDVDVQHARSRRRRPAAAAARPPAAPGRTGARCRGRSPAGW